MPRLERLCIQPATGFPSLASFWSQGRRLIRASRKVKGGVSWGTNHRLYSNSRARCNQDGYKSIGSFHSDNLVDMMKASDTDFEPPRLPFQTQDIVHSTADPAFSIDLDQWTFLNHGAFGGALKVGSTRAAQWRDYLERQPLRYFDRDLLPHLAYATRRLGQFTHLRDDQYYNTLTLLPNVTSGLNSVISSYFQKYQNSAGVILWDTTYGSVKKMVQHHCKHYSDFRVEIPLQSELIPILMTGSTSPEEILLDALSKAMHEALQKGIHPLVILDHVSSNTALTFPIDQLATLVKDIDPCGVVLVDGAHGMLALDVDLPKLLYQSGVDFYLSNAHKWLSAPRGAAFMAVAHYESAWQDSLYPCVISHGADEPDLLSRFVWDGCRDYAACLALPVILDYWEEQNPAAVRAHMEQQLDEGVECLIQAWHPEAAAPVTLAPPASSLVSLSPMRLVRLPSTPFGGSPRDSSDAKRVQDYLYSQYIEVPIKCINGELFVRVSCHVYNTTDHFQILADAIMAFPGFVE